MIPSTISMELRHGLLCSTGEDICTYGQFPLLGSTESLLEKLGFKLCDDLKNVDGGQDDESGRKLSSPLATLIRHDEVKSTKDNGDERLSDVLLKALDDIRDLRHREEEKEDQADKEAKNVSRRTKRINHKVENLEKQRAKLLEKQDGGDDDVDNDNSAELREAWMRMARTFNSARLLLFLFSQDDGLDALANYENDSVSEDGGMKSIGKIVIKLSDALEVLLTSSTLTGNSPSEVVARDAINRWETIITEGIRSRRSTSKKAVESENSQNVIDLVDDPVIDLVSDTVIDLVSDSSSEMEENSRRESELSDNLSDEMMENAIDTENPPVDISDEKIDIPVPKDIPTGSDNNCIHSRFFAWNANLDTLMNALVSALDTETGADDIKLLENAFSSASLDGRSGQTLNEEIPHKRAESLDKRFSLIVGVTGSKEYQTRKKYLLSIEKLRSRVEQRIRQGKKAHEFEDARLDVYGSCLSGLSLGKNADVDLSLTFARGIEKKINFEAGDLTAKKYDRHVTDTVYKIKRKLELCRRVGRSTVEEFRDIEAVPRARVPVIKGVYTDADNPHSEDGSLHFDICLLNDIAVVNSGLIKEYSDIDIRVKSLMIAVKRWTKDNKINAAHENTLSSYTWINMVIFYLQCIGFVPNLQCPKLMKQCNRERSNRRQDNVNNLDTAYLKWNGQAGRVWKRPKDIDENFSSVTMLLYGFFRFYSHEFPSHLYMISIKRGKEARIPKTMFPDRCSLHLCIEDPFETYDSHFPHDLGRPADETGSMLISQSFRDSEEHLRNLLFGEDISPSAENLKLWPITTITKENTGRSRRSRKAEIRDPQMTLVIESKSTNFKKEDLLKIFQKFADLTKSRIVGSSLVNGGRLSFVDFDSVAAVDSALAGHAKVPLEIDGKVLSVSRKSAPGTSKRRSKENKTKENKAPEKNSKKDAKKGEPQTTEQKGNKADTNKGKGKGGQGKTLVIQNISGSISEKGMAKMFRPFAEQTNSKLITVDLIRKKRIVFVDYDSSDAVELAMAEHAKNPLCWDGKTLDVAPKMAPGWKKREKAEQLPTKNSPTKQKAPKKPEKKQTQGGAGNDENPSSAKGDKKNPRKNKQQGKKNKKKGANKPIVNAGESIQEQI